MGRAQGPRGSAVLLRLFGLVCLAGVAPVRTMDGMGTTTDLLPDAVHAFEPSGLPTRIAIHTGTAWITQAGDGHDHIVRAPAVFCPAPRGRVAVQALGGRLRFAVLPLSKTG